MVAIVFSIMWGVVLLDVHQHECECGYRWTHLGILRAGSQRESGPRKAHTCRKCRKESWKRSNLFWNKTE